MKKIIATLIATLFAFSALADEGVSNTNMNTSSDNLSGSNSEEVVIKKSKKSKKAKAKKKAKKARNEHAAEPATPADPAAGAPAQPATPAGQ